MTAPPEPTAHAKHYPEPEPRTPNPDYIKTAWDKAVSVSFSWSLSLALFFPGCPGAVRYCGAVGPSVVSSLLSRVSFFSPFVMSFIVEFLRETISRQFVSHDVADKDFVERTKRLQAKGKEMYVLCWFFAGD